jgi:hypothetical protein
MIDEAKVRGKTGFAQDYAFRAAGKATWVLCLVLSVLLCGGSSSLSSSL